jgi:hypothetical protein
MRRPSWNIVQRKTVSPGGTVTPSDRGKCRGKKRQKNGLWKQEARATAVYARAFHTSRDRLMTVQFTTLFSFNNPTGAAPEGGCSLTPMVTCSARLKRAARMATARCTRSKTPEQRPCQSTQALRPFWSASTTPIEQIPVRN